jgi:hypothetical protein
MLRSASSDRNWRPLQVQAPETGDHQRQQAASVNQQALAARVEQRRRQPVGRVLAAARCVHASALRNLR